MLSPWPSEAQHFMNELYETIHKSHRENNRSLASKAETFLPVNFYPFNFIKLINLLH